MKTSKLVFAAGKEFPVRNFDNPNNTITATANAEDMTPAEYDAFADFLLSHKEGVLPDFKLVSGTDKVLINGISGYKLESIRRTLDKSVTTEDVLMYLLRMTK